MSNQGISSLYFGVIKLADFVCFAGVPVKAFKFEVEAFEEICVDEVDEGVTDVAFVLKIR